MTDEKERLNNKKTGETEALNFSADKNLDSDLKVDDNKTDENVDLKNESKTEEKNENAERNETKSEENQETKDEKSVEKSEDLAIERAENEQEQIEISSEIAEEKLSEVLSSQKPQKRKKSTIINLILLLVNIVFMVFVVRGLINNIGEQDFGEYIKSQGNKLWWLAGGVGCYLLYIFSQTIMFHALIKSLTGKSKWGLSYDIGITGKYYDNVTPFAVGGQPMQIIELSNTGISPGASTSIPLIKMIINSMVSTLLGLVFFIIGLSKITPANSLFALLFVVFEILGIIGLVITILGVLFMIMLSTGNLFTRSLIAWLVKIGYKLKIVKNYRLTLKKWLDQVSEYKSSMAYLMKNKKLLFKMILYSCLESLSYAGISFFVIMAFIDTSYLNTHEMSVWFILFTCIVKYYICSMAGSYIPLPGATGLMEIAFIALYGEFVGDAIVWALLTWRILSYYIILLHGFVHEIIKISKNVASAKRNSKQRTPAGAEQK